MIEIGTKIGLVLSVVISFLTPILMFIYYIIYKKQRLKPFLIGVFVFFISQVILRLPLLSYVLPNKLWYMRLSLNPYLYSIFLGLTAGIFEEVGRYIGFKYFLKNNQKYDDGLSFGFGHWAVEALLIVGINAVALLFSPNLLETSGLSTINAFMMGMERLFVLSVHVGLSMIVLYSVRLNKITYLFAAVILHGIIDAGIGILPQIFNMGTIGMEIYVLIWGLGFLYLIYRLKLKFTKLENIK
ncbi:YhfC family intramembrane metalloprotease [Terrisporobacter mayombei]|uniref:YhfC family intramembrane metalloprotease n=1 Tax=Terrisporobacter mayombei TaxID=1541 RepID=A0ABY9Q2Y2_9FIRM|nr:YhfC family glutamic-type intramembrane protease [Terrisporobacter mayombei]MCC3867654.1 YhfC family intramembrane metalloprotease [Terrisporobacter mayombei]WMT81916.1 hypothetical protein TEMA_22640 [Terrisporobacter mayombei]